MAAPNPAIPEDDSGAANVRLNVEWSGQQHSVTVPPTAQLHHLKKAIASALTDMPVDRQWLHFAQVEIGKDTALMELGIMDGSVIEVQTYPCYNLTPDPSTALLGEGSLEDGFPVPAKTQFKLSLRYANVAPNSRPTEFAAAAPLPPLISLSSSGNGEFVLDGSDLRAGDAVNLQLTANCDDGSAIPIRLTLLVRDVPMQSVSFDPNTWNLELSPDLATATFEIEPPTSLGLGFDPRLGKFRYHGEGQSCARCKATLCCDCLLPEAWEFRVKAINQASQVECDVEIPCRPAIKPYCGPGKCTPALPWRFVCFLASVVWFPLALVYSVWVHVIFVPTSICNSGEAPTILKMCWCECFGDCFMDCFLLCHDNPCQPSAHEMKSKSCPCWCYNCLSCESDWPLEDEHNGPGALLRAPTNTLTRSWSRHIREEGNEQSLEPPAQHSV